METKVFDCCVCLNEYNRTDCIPKVIIHCGHTICSKCLSFILTKEYNPKCPLDRKAMTSKDIRQFPTNLDLLEILEEKQNEAERCPIHKELNEWVCMDDECNVCSYCVHHGEHKGHKAISFQEIKDRADAKRKTYQDEVDKIDVGGLSGILMATVKDKFKKLKEMLVKEEEEAERKMALLFAQQRFKIEIQEITRLAESDEFELNLSEKEAEKLVQEPRRHVVRILDNVSYLLESQEERLYNQISSLEQKAN